MLIRKGQILAITVGEYSDYTLLDHIRASRDFDSTKEIQRFMDTDESHDNKRGSDNRFIAWSIREGIIETMDRDSVIEWHIGEYGKIVPEIEQWPQQINET